MGKNISKFKREEKPKRGKKRYSLKDLENLASLEMLEVSVTSKAFELLGEEKSRAEAIRISKTILQRTLSVSECESPVSSPKSSGEISPESENPLASSFYFQYLEESPETTLEGQDELELLKEQKLNRLQVDQLVAEGKIEDVEDVKQVGLDAFVRTSKIGGEKEIVSTDQPAEDALTISSEALPCTPDCTEICDPDESQNANRLVEIQEEQENQIQEMSSSGFLPITEPEEVISLCETVNPFGEIRNIDVNCNQKEVNQTLLCFPVTECEGSEIYKPRSDHDVGVLFDGQIGILREPWEIGRNVEVNYNHQVPFCFQITKRKGSEIYRPTSGQEVVVLYDRQERILREPTTDDSTTSEMGMEASLIAEYKERVKLRKHQKCFSKISSKDDSGNPKPNRKSSWKRFVPNCILRCFGRSPVRVINPDHHSSWRSFRVRSSNIFNKNNKVAPEFVPVPVQTGSIGFVFEEVSPSVDVF